MVEKQLILVVEGTAALGPYWKTLVSDYIEKIVRCFCGNELQGQKLTGANPQLGLVVFTSHGPYSAFFVQRTGWTKDLDVFLCWLSIITFSGGGFGDAAIAEGLADALTMFPVSTNGSQTLQNLDSQKHCILIAASNPYPLPTPVYYLPNLSTEQSENPEAWNGTCLRDAEGVAKLFAEYCVSLSVISPRQLPKLEAIYNAGRRNPRAADPTTDNVQSSHFTVLISENFMEARAALNPPVIGNLPTNQGIVELDAAASAAVPGPSAIHVPDVHQPLPNYVKIWEGSLFRQEEGHLDFICDLEAYRYARYGPTKRDKLARDWPPIMQIVDIVPQDNTVKERYGENAEFMIFRTLNENGFLAQLKERKLFAVIQLPSQTLLLLLSNRTGHLIGHLFPLKTS